METNHLRLNEQIATAMEMVANTADFLWNKGWAERNGGNLSINLTMLVSQPLPPITTSYEIELSEAAPLLANNLLYITATGSRMREVARDPFARGCFIQFNDTGSNCTIVAHSGLLPSSELPTHILIQQFLKSQGNGYTSVLHTHPTELIALSHCRPFLNQKYLSDILLGMMPEARMFVPKGIGLVQYQKPGTLLLARSTISALVNHDVVLWEKHGVLAVGTNVEECFDSIDILNKSAQIFLSARQAGYVAEGLSATDLNALE